jgi:four helix bundle protein
MMIFKNTSMKKNEVLELSVGLAVEIVKYCEVLEEKKKFVIAHQLLKSGTSIGANVKEAQNSESKQDFIHKLKIAAKEAEETEYWLEIIQQIDTYPKCPESISSTLKSIINLLNKIIITLKTK